MTRSLTIYDSVTDDKIVTVDFQEFVLQKFKIVNKKVEDLEPGEVLSTLENIDEYKRFQGYSIGCDTIGYFCADKKKKKRTRSYPKVEEIKLDELKAD